MSTVHSYIRWSSAPQSDGSSLDRQSDKAVAYCTQQGLTLSDKVWLDAGVSAYKGKNAEEGALRAFMDAVEAGDIPKGDILLIEDLWRLSRLPPRKAQRLLEDIVELGIKVITISDNKEYSTESLDDVLTLIMALLRFDQTHKDSKLKAQAVSRGWDKAIAERPVFTKLCPSWLKPNHPVTREATGFELVPEHVRTVERMFELALTGMGSHTIAKRLEEEQHPTFRDAKHGWNGLLVLAVLTSEAPIGHYQRRGTLVRREKYYPEIIKPHVWRDVQDIIASRSKKFGKAAGGAKHERVVNLFSGLMRCTCGEKCRAVNSSKDFVYLRCLNAFSKKNGCETPPYPYNQIELYMLIGLTSGFAHEPLGALVDDTSSDPRRVLQQEIADKQKRLENLFELVAAQGSSATSGGFAGAAKMIEKLQAEITSLSQKLARVASRPPLVPIFIQARELVHRMWALKDETELFDVRLKMQTTLRQLFNKIVLLPETKSKEEKKVGETPRLPNGDVDWNTPMRVETETVQYRQMVLYGRLIDNLRETLARDGSVHVSIFVKDAGAFTFTEDGGLVWDYKLDPSNTRLEVKRRNRAKKSALNG
jgi:DNA invertase Pin-like site-specific DNA recombinase